MYTSTDNCASLIGSSNICFEIEKSKLIFLGHLCRLSASHISRCTCIFLFRVVFYHDYRNTHAMGLYLLTRLQTGIFPHKPLWKVLVCSYCYWAKIRIRMVLPCNRKHFSQRMYFYKISIISIFVKLFLFIHVIVYLNFFLIMFVTIVDLGMYNMSLCHPFHSNHVKPRWFY